MNIMDFFYWKERLHLKLLLNEEKFKPQRNHTAFPAKEGDRTAFRQAFGGGVFPDFLSSLKLGLGLRPQMHSWLGKE